jgi:hypothetical protein
MRSPFSANSASSLRIIAACVIRSVAGADHLAYLVEGMQKADDHLSLTVDGGHAALSGPPAGLDPAKAWELKFFARFIDRAAQEVTAMKLIIVAVATVFALSSPAFAQSFSSDGLNGATLGKSMRGVNNGVPYPNTNARDGSAPVGRSGATQYGASKHHWHHGHHRHHHRHHRHSGM